MRVFRLAVSLLFLAFCTCGTDDPGKNTSKSPHSGPESIKPVGPTPPDHIRIAAVFPTSGRYEASGRECLNGFMMAVEKVNRGGGVMGRRLFPAVYPTHSDVESTEEAARIAVVEGAVVLIGSNASQLSARVAKVAEEHNVVMITNVSTATDLTKGKDHVFRTCYSNDYVARLLARYVWSGLKKHRVAVLQEVSRPYSKDLGDEFFRYFKRLVQEEGQGEGRADIETWQYVSMEPDFTHYLTQIQEFRPGALFLPASFDDATLVAIHLKAMGIHLTMVGGDSWSNAKLFMRGGPGCPAYHSDYWDGSPDNPFYQAYLGRYNVPPQGGRAALAHDAVQAVVMAIYALGRPLKAEDLAGAGLAATRMNLMKCLRGVKVVGATEVFKFDSHGNAVRPCYVFKVVGQTRTLATILK